VFTETDELWMYIAIFKWHGKRPRLNNWKSTVLGRNVSLLEDIKIEKFYSDELYNSWLFDSIDPFIWNVRER